MKKYVIIFCIIVCVILLVIGFWKRPELFHITFVSKEVRSEVVSVDLGKALEHYYDEWGRYPVTEDEDEILTILRNANYLKDEGALRAGEFIYEPVNRGQTYTLK